MKKGGCSYLGFEENVNISSNLGLRVGRRCAHTLSLVTQGPQASLQHPALWLPVCPSAPPACAAWALTMPWVYVAWNNGLDPDLASHEHRGCVQFSSGEEGFVEDTAHILPHTYPAPNLPIYIES